MGNLLYAAVFDCKLVGHLGAEFTYRETLFNVLQGMLNNRQICGIPRVLKSLLFFLQERSPTKKIKKREVRRIPPVLLERTKPPQENAGFSSKEYRGSFCVE